MSVICKKVLVCNRCGCETVVDDTKYLAAANIKLTTVPLDERYRLINFDNSDIWDSFYLCTKCMDLVRSVIEGEDYILPKMLEKNEKPPEDEDTVPTGSWHVKGPDPDEMEFEEIDLGESEEDDDLDSEEPKDEPIIDDWDPNNNERRERIVWDDYIVEKVVKLMKIGYTREMVCVKLKLTESQFTSFLFNVRHPEKFMGGDNTKYIRWNKKYGDVLCSHRKEPRMNIDDDLKGEILAEIKSGKKLGDICKEFNICKTTLFRLKKEFGIRDRVPAEERFTPKLVREMFEARKDGMSWNSIAQILNIPAGTVYTFTNRLREAKEGDWMYDLAKEYGYIND